MVPWRFYLGGLSWRQTTGGVQVWSIKGLKTIQIKVWALTIPFSLVFFCLLLLNKDRWKFTIRASVLANDTNPLRWRFLKTFYERRITWKHDWYVPCVFIFDVYQLQLANLPTCWREPAQSVSVIQNTSGFLFYISYKRARGLALKAADANTKSMMQ